MNAQIIEGEDLGDFYVKKTKEIMESQDEQTKEKEVIDFVKQLITDIRELLSKEFQRRAKGEKIPEKIPEVVKYIEAGKIPSEYFNKIPGDTIGQKAEYLISNALLLNTNILIKLFSREKQSG